MMFSNRNFPFDVPVCGHLVSSNVKIMYHVIFLNCEAYNENKRGHILKASREMSFRGILILSFSLYLNFFRCPPTKVHKQYTFNKRLIWTGFRYLLACVIRAYG